MATDTAEGWSSHIRGMTVTTLASVSGVVAGLASSALTAGAANPATDRTALLVLGAAIAVQFPILRLVGIDVEGFSTKDFVYVAFMTFALWFVSWGILLTAGTTVTL